MKRKMEQHEYFTLICTVKDAMNWDCIVEAYTRGLPNVVFTEEHVKSINTLRTAGILDGLRKLDAKWRKAIDDVCAGKPIFDLSDDDKKLVVDVWYRSEFTR
jgi:hypothetical protein